MNSLLQTAYQTILYTTNIPEEILPEILGLAMGSKIDYADLYFQSMQKESWSLEDGIIVGGSFIVDKGVGIRAISGDKTGFAYSDELNIDILRQTAIAARSIVKTGKTDKIKIALHNSAAFKLYPIANPLGLMTDEDKTALLREVDLFARKQDHRVKQVLASLHGSHETILIVASDGTLAADIRPLVRLNITVVVEENDRRETGSSGGGIRGDFQYFLDNDRAFTFVREAIRIALVNLAAIPAPAGSMPVVLGCGWPAVLLHEAIGHGLEGDFIRKGSSVYSNKLGTKIAASECTIVDQGNLPEKRRGSLNVDDEGTLTQCTTLIENGVLCGF